MGNFEKLGGKLQGKLPGQLGKSFKGNLDGSLGGKLQGKFRGKVGGELQGKFRGKLAGKPQRNFQGSLGASFKGNFEGSSGKLQGKVRGKLGGEASWETSREARGGGGGGNFEGRPQTSHPKPIKASCPQYGTSIIDEGLEFRVLGWTGDLWGFPKIGDPNIVYSTLISRIPIIRTPK